MLTVLLLLGLAMILFSLNNIYKVTERWKKNKQGTKDAKLRESHERNYRLVRAFWLGCEGIYAAVPFKMDELKQAQLNFWFERIDFYSETLKRTLVLAEIKGFLYGCTCVGFILLIPGYFIGGAIGFTCLLLGLTCFFSNLIFTYICNTTIKTQNAEIEKEIPNLYLLLYSKLIAGTATIATTLNNYLKVLNATSKSNKSMSKFIADWLGYIVIVGEIEAVRLMAMRYNSLLAVNLLNIVRQRLDGVDNKDKLLTFKVELAHLELSRMRKQNAKKMEKGLRLLKAVFFILVEVIILYICAHVAVLFNVGKR